MVTSTTTVLECIQFTSTNIGELISFLVQSGRAFRTHRSCDQIPLPIYCYSPPIVRSSYQSVSRLPSIQEDYTYYEETHANFLSPLWGCTALLWGSIIWHLTIEVLGDCAEDIVLNGPLDDVLRFGSKICYNRNKFWDSGLNEAEMDLVCGVYKLYSKCQTPLSTTYNWFIFITEQGDQFADISWWPKQLTFMVLGLNIGFWLPDCELWFQSQAQEILQKISTVKSARAWTVALKYGKPRMLKLNNNQVAIASRFLLASESNFLPQLITSACWNLSPLSLVCPSKAQHPLLMSSRSLTWNRCSP